MTPLVTVDACHFCGRYPIPVDQATGHLVFHRITRGRGKYRAPKCPGAGKMHGTVPHRKLRSVERVLAAAEERRHRIPKLNTTADDATRT